MARKPRIHYPGAVYHVILRGNDGQDIFFNASDRSRFCLLLQEGVERYEHRIHAFCLMTNHVHLAIQVGDVSLSRIMQNLCFRYTRYINWRKKRIGHLFQGRYKALLLDVDNYLLELVRYIHCNPVRARLVQSPDEYRYSSHRAYLDAEFISWMTTEWILSQFARQKKRARMLYHEFVLEGIQEDRREEFYRGECEGRILGDDQFSEKALERAEEKFQRYLSLDQIIDIVCEVYSIDTETLTNPGKKRPASEARAVAALLVQETENLTMTALGHYLRRDISSLSQAANRLGSRAALNTALAEKLVTIRKKLTRIPKCQA